jgi:hypothetical protein
VRLYSHQNDSGCFFIAVLKKICNTDELFREKHIVQNLSNEVVQKSIGDDIADFAKFLGINDDEVTSHPNIDMSEMNDEVNIIMKKEIKKADDVIFTQFVKFKEYKENYEMVTKF